MAKPGPPATSVQPHDLAALKQQHLHKLDHCTFAGACTESVRKQNVCFVRDPAFADPSFESESCEGGVEGGCSWHVGLPKHTVREVACGQLLGLESKAVERHKRQKSSAILPQDFWSSVRRERKTSKSAALCFKVICS